MRIAVSFLAVHPFANVVWDVEMDTTTTVVYEGTISLLAAVRFVCPATFMELAASHLFLFFFLSPICSSEKHPYDGDSTSVVEIACVEGWMHRLVLPLPRGYASDTVTGDVGEYSVFDAAGDGALPGQVVRYMDDLVRFLNTYRLIQYHPEHFFTYRLASERAESGTAPMKHLDGRAITDAEVLNLRQLCGAFESIIALAPDGGRMENLASLIRDGPTRSDLAPPLGTKAATDVASLDAFFRTTKDLMLHRTRRPSSDYASLTFQHNGPLPPLRHADGGETLLRFMGDHAMCAKKYHEVQVMRDCIIDMLRNTPSVRGLESNRHANDSELVGATVINVGEGKGYCSRVLALCDGLQVVGLDCNPHHKEGASGRVERLVQGAVGSSKVHAPNQPAASTLLNPLYRPRGHMASVVCRVGQKMDWLSVLQGHVALTTGNGDLIPIAVTVPEGLKGCALGAMPLPTTKVQCRLCGQVYRGHCSDIAMKHARDHVKSARHHADHVLRCKRTGTPLPLQPADFDALVASKPQQQCVAEVVAAFYDTTADTVRNDVPLEASPSHGRSTNDGGVMEGVGSLVASPAVFARGTRLVVWVGIQLEERKRVRPDDGGADLSSYVRKCAVKAHATILGYDEGTQRHKIQLDALREDQFRDEDQEGGPGNCSDAAPMTVVNLKNLNKQFMCSILAPSALPMTPSTALAAIEAVMAAAPATARWPSRTGVVPVVLLAAVVPIRQPIATPIVVPDLSNAGFMGLHTCGDLGSNICRLYLSSGAPSLTLVSCCWHALTNGGFPLSQTVRAYGYRTESISLMLATQPLDMWCTDPAQGNEDSAGRSMREDAGHRGSARLLFLRGLLPMVWADLSAAFESECAATCCQAGGVCRRRMLPLPHLEPPFLRKMARVKDSISLHAFTVAVLEEYCCDAHRRHKYVAATHERVQGVDGGGDAGGADNRALCDQCADWVYQLVGAAHSGALHASANRLEAVHFRLNFRPFLGLTVLRMWMSHLVESLLLMDRVLYLHEMLCDQRTPSDVALVPLFDGALSPRMFGILARRGGGALGC